MNLEALKVSYSGVLPSNAIALGLEEYLPKGSDLYVHPDTGVVTSELKMSPSDVLNYWSDKIFSNPDPEQYTAHLPFAKSRLLYVLETAFNFVRSQKLNPSVIADFAFGEGVLFELGQLHTDSSLSWTGTEGSKTLCDIQTKKGYTVYNKMLGDGGYCPVRADIGFITWTLCNCISPYDVLSEVHNYINENGYLVIAESSRVLVPFRKSLNDLLNKFNPADTHPYYFSSNSLQNLLRLCGFEPVFTNRYYDSDVLLVVAKKVDLNKSLIMDEFKFDNLDDIIEFFLEYKKHTRFIERVHR